MSTARRLSLRSKLGALAVLCAVAAYTASVAVAADPKPVSEWGNRASLAEPNSEMAVAYLDGKIYVVGGYPSTRKSVDTVQAFDVATDKWTLTTPYPTTINHASAVGLDGLLYVIGGQTNAGGRREKARYTAAVHSYDPKTGKWTPRAPMPTARSAMAHDIIDGKIYVAGGRPPRGHDFAVYDPRLTSGPPCPTSPRRATTLPRPASTGSSTWPGDGSAAGSAARSPRPWRSTTPPPTSGPPGGRCPWPAAGSTGLP